MMTLLEKFSFFSMSFCMVGKVEAPPKANNSVPKDRKKSLKPWFTRFTGSSFSKPSITIWVKNRTHAMAVVRIAPTPTMLKRLCLKFAVRYIYYIENPFHWVTKLNTNIHYREKLTKYMYVIWKFDCMTTIYYTNRLYR